MSRKIKKFPKVDKELFESPLVAKECKQCIKEYEDWRLNAVKELEKAKKMLNEILDSELMKQAQKFMPRSKDRWEGQLSVIEEILESLKNVEKKD